MRKATTILLTGMLLTVMSVSAQTTDYAWVVELADELAAPFSFNHSGSREVNGPYDLDGDGKIEVLVADYTGGGRVHVIENVGVDTWEHVYSTPVLDSTNTTNNMRTVAGGDVDGDGLGEIYFFAGRSYKEGSPFPPGLYVFEATGADDDYGTAPTSIYEFVDLPDRWRQEQIVIKDLDKDGSDEIMFGNNGAASEYDRWYILGVEGDIGSGFETWIEEAVWTSRATTSIDKIDRGGGSPYAIVSADLDGNGRNEIVMHSWNCMNITLGEVLGPNLYTAPGNAGIDRFVHMANPGAACGSPDTVSLFGIHAYDVDNDGNEEVYGTTYSAGGIWVINYDPGENFRRITEDNFTYNLVPGRFTLGLTIGDLDGDGNTDFIGTGTTYEADDFNADEAPNWIDIVEFNGGDPEDPANYSDPVSVYFPDDKLDSFDLVVQDSAGVITEYRESGEQGGEFVSKLAFLGDPDGDGWNEVALGFQGVDDSTYVFNTTFNPADSTYSRVQVQATANPLRTFMRVLASDGTSIAIQDDRIVVPTDYILEQNYPNPFNPETTIRFTLPVDKSVSVRIFDVTGRLVKTLVDNQHFFEGTHEVNWNGTNGSGLSVASGTYIYALEYGNFRQTKTMVLLK